MQTKLNKLLTKQPKKSKVKKTKKAQNRKKKVMSKMMLSKKRKLEGSTTPPTHSVAGESENENELWCFGCWRAHFVVLIEDWSEETKLAKEESLRTIRFRLVRNGVVEEERKIGGGKCVRELRKAVVGEEKLSCDQGELKVFVEGEDKVVRRRGRERERDKARGWKRDTEGMRENSWDGRWSWIRIEFTWWWCLKGESKEDMSPSPPLFPLLVRGCGLLGCWRARSCGDVDRGADWREFGYSLLPPYFERQDGRGEVYRGQRPQGHW